MNTVKCEAQYIVQALHRYEAVAMFVLLGDY